MMMMNEHCGLVVNMTQLLLPSAGGISRAPGKIYSNSLEEISL